MTLSIERADRRMGLASDRTVYSSKRNRPLLLYGRLLDDSRPSHGLTATNPDCRERLKLRRGRRELLILFFGSAEVGIEDRILVDVLHTGSIRIGCKRKQFRQAIWVVDCNIKAYDRPVTPAHQRLS